MEENNNSPRTLKIELPVVDNSGHDEEDDEEGVEHHVADKAIEQEGETRIVGDNTEKTAENPGDEEQKQTHTQNHEKQESEPKPVETEEKRAFLTDKDETFIEEDKNLRGDKHLIGGKENTINTERITEGPEVNLTEHKSSSANATPNPNKEKLNLPVTHSANGAKLIDHSDTETVVSYDPTGTHIIEYSESQSYVEAASEIELKKVEEADKLQIQTKSNVSEKSNLQNITEDTNNDPSNIHKHIERPSDTVPRPVKHKRKQQLALTAEEEDLGIYEDTADGDDLTDTELEVMKSKFRSAKLHKEYEKVLEEAELKTEHKNTEKPITEESMTMKPIAEAVKRTKPTIKSAPKPLREINVKDFKEFRERLERGKTAVSCITEVFQESRNASRLALESREAMFRRAMTLLQTRCTSMKQGLDPDDIHAPFGIQVPKYIYVTQEKPLPMEPLKAWRGYNGNVYFEPIQVNPLKNSTGPGGANESPKDTGRLPTKQSQRKPEPDKSLSLIKAGSESRSDSRQTIKSSSSGNVGGNRPTTRQMAILDKQTVINRFNESLHEDIIWLEGQENTGSLAIRPRTQPNVDRKKDLLYNKERLCKGSVAHKLYVERKNSSKRPRFSVSGGKFTPPNSMSPLLRTQTQYSLSSQRLTTNSPDLYHHLNDTKLPALDQIKASLKHSDGSREKTYTRPLTVTTEMKPFVKYSPDVVAKFAQQAM